MSSTNAHCDAVLIFDQRRPFEPETLIAMVEKALQAKGLEILVSDDETPHEKIFQTDELTLTMKCDGCDNAETIGRLMISIGDISQRVHADLPLVLLAEICRKAILLTDAQQIVWLRKDVIFSAKQFLSAFAPVKPRRPTRSAVTKPQRPNLRRASSTQKSLARRLPQISQTEEQLNRAFQEMASEQMPWTSHFSDEEEAALAQAIRIDEAGRHDPDEIALSRQTRITAWIMTAMLAFFSWPIAAFMVVYNALKGEDFRLSTRVLALAGTFGLLNASGATAQTLTMLLT